MDPEQFAYHELKTADGREVVFYATLCPDLDAHGAAGVCSQGKDGAFIRLNPNRINLQTIVHEIDHAVGWCAALGALNGREEEAHHAGVWFEAVVAELLRAGWTWTTKCPDTNVFNTDLLGLALRAPSAEDEAEALTRAAYEEWKANPSGNSAVANLRNKLCAVIGEREDLRRDFKQAEEGRVANAALYGRALAERDALAGESVAAPFAKRERSGRIEYKVRGFRGSDYVRVDLESGFVSWAIGGREAGEEPVDALAAQCFAAAVLDASKSVGRGK